MKIKNKYSKNKIDKRNVIFNNIMNIKKVIRNKTTFIKPLSKTEEFLFNDLYDPSFKDHFNIPKGKYLKVSDIFLLNTVHKKDCENLFYGILNLYKDNYLKGYLGGEIRTKELKKCIMSFSTSSNNQHWSNLCNISPNDKELYALCDYINISLFEISNDILGIVFQLNVTDEFNKQINEIFDKDINKKVIYDKYRYKKKHIYSRSFPTAEQIRNNEYEDFILEFKHRFNKLFTKYLPLQLNYSNNPPISLNSYQTNVDSIDRKETFITSLELIKDYSKKEIKDVSICIRDKEHSDTFIKTTAWYDISIKYDKIDRSNNVIFVVDDERHKIIHSPNAFINFYISSLVFFLLDEMNEDLASEKYKLYNCSSNKIQKNYTQYEKINTKFHKYSSIFNGISIYKHDYADKYLTDGFEHLQEIYNDYNSQYDNIKKEYEFRININNIRSSYKLALISIIIALFALSISIYFEYRNKNNDKINEIKEQVNFNNETTSETNNLITQIKDLLKEK